MAADPAKTSVRSLLGEQKSTFSEIQLSGGNPSDWTYSFGAGYNRTDGFGERKAGQPRDSYTVPVLTGDVQKRFKHGSLLLSLGNSEATTDYNESVAFQDAKFHTSYASLTYKEDTAKNPILARVYYNSLILNGLNQNFATMQTYDAEIQQSRTLSAAHNLVYGISLRHGQASSFATGAHNHTEELFALYAQDDFRFGPRTHLFAGVRFDEHSLYGLEFTPRLSLVHSLPSKQSLRLSYGTSFRNPSLANTFLDYKVDLAPGLTSVITGNRDLKPEKVSSIEMGYRKEVRGGYFGANLFYNKVTGLIDTVPITFAPSPPFPAGIALSSSYKNILNASVLGMELEGEFRISKGVRALANYSYQDAEYDQGSRVDFSPRHKANLGIQANLSSRVDGYLGVHFVGSSTYQSPTGLQTNPAYTRVDARLGYRFGPPQRSWTVSAVVTNLFDDKHLEVPVVTLPVAAIQSTPQRRTLYMMLSGKF